MAKVGYEFAPHRFTVERGKIREFVRAIGDDNPVYTDPQAAGAAGYRDVIAPPTYLTVMDNWSGPDFESRCRELEIDPLKVLHAEQAYEYLADIHPGDELDATARVTEVYEKSGKSGHLLFIVVEKTYKRNAQPVAVCRSTTVVRN
ncbi:MAG: MaoC family dehydratase N-terminal domain-containing protein [bacterium]